MLLLVGGVAYAGPDRFLVSIDDLPLMEGLTEESGETLVFDTPDGRIVRAAASGYVSAPEIWEFYTKTLPNLGWAALPAEGVGDGLSFRRGGERLDVRTEPGAGGTVIVHFGLRPWQ